VPPIERTGWRKRRLPAPYQSPATKKEAVPSSSEKCSLITSAGGPNRIAIIPLPQPLYLHRAKTRAISPILRWTVALIEANLLAIAVIVAALTMALAVVLEPRQTISRHIAGSDNAENNADFCYPVALHTPIASFKLLPSSAASTELQTKCSGLHSGACFRPSPAIDSEKLQLGRLFFALGVAQTVVMSASI
jgi:hypothetical protein